MAKKQLSRSQKKRLKKKQQAKEQDSTPSKPKHEGNIAAQALREITAKAAQPEVEENIEIEYVSSGTREVVAAKFPELAGAFARFAPVEELLKSEEERAVGDGKDGKEGAEEDAEGAGGPLSKRKKKAQNRLTVAELKALVRRPDKVEAWDVSSSDPRLLVHLKAYRNSVPVPRHWSHKRKYLQGKRGIEKPPFELPDFIAATGVTKIKEAVEEADAEKGSKARARERLHGKMGKVNIDSRVMHDAFFRFQTKPSMTGHGDIYYEGKEFEVEFKEKRPGALSSKLKEALGMSDTDPTPWLINQQRYGPPPSYPHLRIPGLNAPIPPGAQFGYGPGGWGKPPVDAMGRPLYGDVFGAEQTEAEREAEEVDRSKWGQIEEEVYEEEEESSDEEEGAEEGAEAQGEADGAEEPTAEELEMGAATPAGDGGMSVATGMYTPSSIDPRKAGTETPSAPKPLYHVLEQKKASVGNALFGSSHTYAVPASEIKLSIDPDQLATMDEAMLRRKYEEAVEAQQNGRGNTSNTSLLAQVLEERRRKRRPQPADASQAKKSRSGL